MIVTALRSEGFEVFEAATGEEALALARSRAPDLIVANPLIARGWTVTSSPSA